MVRRYKRFLADVRLRNGRVVTAHCPNSGSMRTCSEPGRPVYLSSSDNPRRKLGYTWELMDQVAAGHRAVIFFLIQRMDAARFAPADRVDPAYGEALRRVVEGGVEALAWDVEIDLERIRLRRAVPVDL